MENGQLDPKKGGQDPTIPPAGVFDNLIAIVLPILVVTLCAAVLLCKRQAVMAILKEFRGKRVRVGNDAMSSRGKKPKDGSAMGSSAPSTDNSQDVTIFVPSGVTADVLGKPSAKQLHCISEAQITSLSHEGFDGCKPTSCGPAVGAPRGAPMCKDGSSGLQNSLSPASSSQHSIPSHTGNASDSAGNMRTPQNPQDAPRQAVRTHADEPLGRSWSSAGQGSNRLARNGMRAWEPVLQRWRTVDELKEEGGDLVECSVSPGLSLHNLHSISSPTGSHAHTLTLSCGSQGSPGRRSQSLRADWRGGGGNASGLCVWRCKDDRELGGAARPEPPVEALAGQICDLQTIVRTSPVFSARKDQGEWLLNDEEAARKSQARATESAAGNTHSDANDAATAWEGDAGAAAGGVKAPDTQGAGQRSGPHFC